MALKTPMVILPGLWLLDGDWYIDPVYGCDVQGIIFASEPDKSWNFLSAGDLDKASALT